MRISLPSRAYGFALVLLAVLACALFVLALPAGARAAEACPNEQVRRESDVNPVTGEPYDLALPECRAYEKVSPDEKDGHSVELYDTEQVFAAPNGDALVYTSVGSFAGAEGSSGVLSNNNYLSVRGETGWSTSAEFLPAPIAPSPLGLSLEEGWLFAPSLSRMAVCGYPGEGAPVTEVAVVCAIHEPDGSWVASPHFPNSPNSTVNVNPDSINLYGASSDLSHIIFMLKKGRLLTADNQPGCNESTGIYEMAGLGTDSPVALRLVNVDNNGVEIGSALLGDSCQGGGSGTGNGFADTAYHAVSENGNIIYFEATPTGGVQTLFARIGASHTVTISEPSSADCSECLTSAQKTALFQGASVDGSEVFFSTEQELLPGRRSNNLYEYNMNAPSGHQISVVTAGSSKAEVQGVVGISNDGSHIYFVARSILTSEPNADGGEPVLGADNLYVYERDQMYPAGHTSFVAALCSKHAESGLVKDSQCENASVGGVGEQLNDSHLWTRVDGKQLGERNDDITPNGDYITFQTWAQPAPGDTNRATAIYRYDAMTHEVTWVSHASPDFTVHSNENLNAELPARNDGDIGANPAVNDAAPAISEDGSDIIFSTNEALQPDDVNKVRDVYLWHEGTVSLISDGQAVHGTSSFSAMSSSGADIYFQTFTQLTGQDTDKSGDIYDARIDGGFPAPVPSEECGTVESGEACQGVLSALPSFASPGSASFSGGGNVAPSGSEASRAGPVKPRSLTRTQELAAALKMCRKEPKRKRASCKARARKRYGTKAKAKGKLKSKAKDKKSNRRGN